MTAQIPELLGLDGEDVYMTFCPPLPEGHPRLIKRRDLTSEDSIVVASTACWRRYQGTWAIIDERLYLMEVSGRWELLDDDPLFAEWFSGVLRIPQGDELQYVHMGFGTVFEQELHVEVEAGRVVGRRTLDNRGKEYDRGELAFRNLPGSENRFEGDGRGPWTRLPKGIVRFLSGWLRPRGGAS